MKMTWIREKMMQGAAVAADQQPARCVKCGEAVSHIRRNDCACIRAERRNADHIDGYDCDDLGESPDY